MQMARSFGVLLVFLPVSALRSLTHACLFWHHPPASPLINYNIVAPSCVAPHTVTWWMPWFRSRAQAVCDGDQDKAVLCTSHWSNYISIPQHTTHNSLRCISLHCAGLGLVGHIAHVAGPTRRDTHVCMYLPEVDGDTLDRIFEWVLIWLQSVRGCASWLGLLPASTGLA